MRQQINKSNKSNKSNVELLQLPSERLPLRSGKGDWRFEYKPFPRLFSHVGRPPTRTGRLSGRMAGRETRND